MTTNITHNMLTRSGFISSNFSPFVENKTLEQYRDLRDILDDNLLTTVYKTVYSGDMVDANVLNTFFTSLAIDLDNLANSVQSISSDTVVAVNNIYNDYSMIRTNMSNLNSMINILELLNNVTDNDTAGIVETFNDTNSIVSQSNGLTVNTTEGIVTLPVKSKTTIGNNNIKYVINSDSNGEFTAGKTLDKLFDTSDVTHMEYSSSNPLTLDFTLYLTKPEYINNIQLELNNYGFQNWIEAEDILVSIDKKHYTSVFDNSDIMKRFIQNTFDESFVFKADASLDSKNFAFSFMYKQCLAIRFILKQNRPNPVDDLYKISIKRIELNTIVYDSTGELTIKKQIPTSKIYDVVLKAEQNIVKQNGIYSIDYSVSLDGQTFYAISPPDYDSTITEVLSFNQPWMASSINNVVNNVDFLYIKMTIKRNITKANIAELFPDFNIKDSEFFKYPSTLPYSVQLKHAPVLNSIVVSSLPYATIGDKRYNTIKLGVTSAKTYYYSFQLPFNPNGVEKIFVGNKSLPLITNPAFLYDGVTIGYYIDTNNNKVHIALNNSRLVSDRHYRANIDPWDEGIGDDSTLVLSEPTLTVAAVLDITMLLDYEYIDAKGSSIVRLNLLSDGVQENFKVWKYIPSDADSSVPTVSNYRDIIPAGTIKIKLSHSPVKNGILGKDNNNVQYGITGWYPVKYIDGGKEFVGIPSHVFSIDMETDTLYLKSIMDIDMSIYYCAYNQFLLKDVDFAINDDLQSISIADWAYEPLMMYKVGYNIAIALPGESYTLTDNGQTVQLTSKSIIDVLYGNNELKDKYIKITYAYRQKADELFDTISKYTTPIVSKVSLLYNTAIL